MPTGLPTIKPTQLDMLMPGCVVNILIDKLASGEYYCDPAKSCGQPVKLQGTIRLFPFIANHVP